MNANGLLNEARTAAGLSQRTAAQRARVPQSTIARIETGTISPRLQTFVRILEALGYALELKPVYGLGVDRSLIRRMLQLSPQERIEYVVAGGEALAKLRAATEGAR